MPTANLDKLSVKNHARYNNLLNPVLLAGILGLPAMALACDECGDDSCINNDQVNTLEGGGTYIVAVDNGDVTDDGNGNVSTGEDSSCVILFENGATIRLGENQDLNILDFVADPFSEANSALNNQEPAVKKLTSGGGSDGGKSPSAAAGIRG